MPDCLEASSIAGAARLLGGARLGLRALASAANIRSVEADAFLSTVDRVHEVDLTLDAYVSAVLALHAAALAALCPAKELLELFKYVAEWLATALLLPELVLEALKTGEPAESSAKAAERVTTGLLLLVARHARLVVYAPLGVVAKCLIGFAELCELFLGAFCLVDIRVVLLRLLEVGFFDIGRVGAPADSQRLVVVLRSVPPGERPHLLVAAEK